MKLSIVPPPGIVDDEDDRWTPDEVFLPLHREHGFTIDLAASKANAKLARYFDEKTNALIQPWRDEFGFCNPPYSNISPFLEKGHDEVLSLRGGCPLVVYLLPATRTDQRWWQKWIEPYRDRGRGIRTRFLSGRGKFGTPRDPKPTKSRCRFGCVVVVFERRDRNG